jgi:opacity protein-like surface antigen
MKNIKSAYAVIIILIASVSNFSAQTGNDESENCVGKGKVIIDAYYGYPYLAGKYVKDVIYTNNNQNTLNGNTNTLTSIFNLNHVGFKAEYMINRMIGLGFEYSYASVVAKYSELTSVNQNGNYVNQTLNYTAKMTKQRILAKVNIHFATSKHLDPYATGGLGYKLSVVTSDNPNDQKSVYDINNSFLNIIPISFRLGVGLRYFFTKNFGASVEAGIGGPIIQGGLCAKF